MDFQPLTYAQRNLREPPLPSRQWDEVCNEIRDVSAKSEAADVWGADQTH